MFPKLKILVSALFFFTIASNFVQSNQVLSQSGGGPPISISSPTNGQTVKGIVQIVIDGEEVALKVWVWLRKPNMEWVEIYQGLPQSSYPWNTTLFSDGDYRLKGAADFGLLGGSQTQDVDVIVDNTSDDPPPQPPLQPPPSGGDTEDNQLNNPASQQPTSTSQTLPSNPKLNNSNKESGAVEKAIIEEEIPITIDSFDSDLFLRGSNVEIEDIKNIKNADKTFLQFSGTAKPNTLVTLYIFSNATVAVVKSDDRGNWTYTRDKELPSGKHTAFATIYDDGVTRRSNVVEFFVTKSKSGQSLVLASNNLERFYPYAAVLGGTIVFAILILYLYRIYSRRKLKNI